MKIARAIRNGLIVPGATKAEKNTKPKVYAIWDDDNDEPKEDHPMHIPPPKMSLPRKRLLELGIALVIS